jgi:hypothetical protein
VSKGTFTFTVKDAVDEYGMPIVLEVPFTVTTQETNSGTRMAAELNMTPYEGESFKVALEGTFDIPEKSGGASSNIKASLDIDSEADGVVIASDITGHMYVNADGVTDLNAGAKGKINGQSFSFKFAYDGKTNTETEKSGSVSLSYDISSGAKADGGMPSKASVSFDTLIKSGPLEIPGESAYKDLQPVNPMRASYNVIDRVSGDMYGALMQGVGVLMQTRGLSGIIGGLMNAA